MKTGLGRTSLMLLALVGLLSVALASTAVAAPAPGANGQVSACYRVKGKAKGAMRVVPAGKKCKKGERKLAWSVTGPPGAQGATGAQGGQGAQGPSGSNGTDGSNGTPATGVVALETKVASLTLEVANLEGILDGVTNVGLTEAVKAVPQVGALCTQATSLTSQSNLLGAAMGGLSLNGILTGLGGLLNIPALPAALPAFTCPS
jgi:hypothetical protein